MENEENKSPYKVIINGRYTYFTQTDTEAWDIIGKAPFGSLYEVYDEKNNIRPEFIPF